MYEELQGIVGQAIVDAEFREALLDDPTRVLGAYDLTPEEYRVISNIHCRTLQGFAQALDSWICRDTLRLPEAVAALPSAVHS